MSSRRAPGAPWSAVAAARAPPVRWRGVVYSGPAAVGGQVLVLLVLLIALLMLLGLDRGLCTLESLQQSLVLRVDAPHLALALVVVEAGGPFPFQYANGGRSVHLLGNIADHSDVRNRGLDLGLLSGLLGCRWPRRFRERLGRPAIHNVARRHGFFVDRGEGRAPLRFARGRCLVDVN